MKLKLINRRTLLPQKRTRNLLSSSRALIDFARGHYDDAHEIQQKNSSIIGWVGRKRNDEEGEQGMFAKHPCGDGKKSVKEEMQRTFRNQEIAYALD